MKRVCIVTGSRAEYGLLKPLISMLDKDDDISLQLVVTGSHLSYKHGYTIKEIEADGFKSNQQISLPLDDDSPLGITNSMGVAISEFGRVFNQLKPDIIIVLGDRYEIFMAASAATIFRIPIAHLYGGELTLGAYDDAFRHCITKMSQIHFTSTEEYRKRVVQLGEHPDRVYNVGALGVENIKKLKLLSQEQLEEQLNFKIDGNTLLVTFHPVTLNKNVAEVQFKELLISLNSLNNIKIIFTKSNADTDGMLINKLIDEYVMCHKNAIAFDSMGQLKYLNTMKYISAVVGNSSSGIIEAPSLHVPTVNIGDRQKGRIQAESIINCEANATSIRNAIELALSPDFNNNTKSAKNPYEGKNTVVRIIEIIKRYLLNDSNLKKTFYDVI